VGTSEVVKCPLQALKPARVSNAGHRLCLYAEFLQGTRSFPCKGNASCAPNGFTAFVFYKYMRYTNLPGAKAYSCSTGKWTAGLPSIPLAGRHKTRSTDMAPTAATERD
jgi:hypothetical protein